MSSALQALSNCYAFSSYFLECHQYVSHLSAFKHQQQKSNESSFLNMSIANNYMKLMRELWIGKKYNASKNGSIISEIQSFTPSEMVHAIKLNNTMFRGYMQHDSQELLIYLMDQLHEELKRPVVSVLRKRRETANPSIDKGKETTENENEQYASHACDLQENELSMSSHYENENNNIEDTNSDDEITVIYRFYFVPVGICSQIKKKIM